MRKSVVIVCISLLLSLASGAVAKDLEVVRFGLTPFLDYGPWLLAYEKGWFAEEGIDLRVINLASDSEIAEALAGAAIDVGCQSPDSALFYYPEHPELRIPLINTLFRGFYITGQKKYKTYEQFLAEVGDPAEAARLVCSQLKGARILTELGSVHETIVMAALAVAGLTREDAVIIDIPSPAEGVAAFIRGDGDFFTCGLPQTLRLDSLGYPRTIPGSALGPGGVNLSGIQVNASYYENHKDVLIKLTKIWYRAVAYVHSNPTEALHVIVDWLNENVGANINYDDAFALITKELSWPGSPIEAWFWFYDPDSPYNWKTKLEYRLNMTYEMGLIPAGSVDLDTMVNADEIEAAVLQLFAGSLEF